MSRATILAAVRNALRSDPVPATDIPRAYRRRGEFVSGSAEVIELLIDRLIDYRAVVHHIGTIELPVKVRDTLRASKSVVIPEGLPAEIADACRADGRDVTVDGAPIPLTAIQLDGIDTVVTRASIAIALSGTIILDGQPDQGRRAISLVPDHHVVVLDAAQVVETAPEAIAQLDPTRPLTMISGPSATSDIELERVEGVHGPRHLEVIIVS